MCLGRKFGVRCGVAKRAKFNNAQHSKFGLASVAKMGGACGRSKHSENGAVWAGDFSLSLVARTFWHAFALILQGFSHTQILKQKFKFFTQNSRHFVNSKHFTNSTRFINLSQISSHTQGFFISLPQIFAHLALINLVERRSYGSSWHKRQDKNSRAD